MKIWIDLTNSPHVNFFAGIIKELRTNHETLLTCRPLANTIELLEINKLPYQIVGRHYGPSLFKKSIGFFWRTFQLFILLRKKNMDVAVSHSSFYSPFVSKILNIRNVYLNDNEYARGNRISFIFADHILVPEYLELSKILKQGAAERKVIRYPGLKEGVYLWRYLNQEHKTGLDFNGEKNDKVIYIRPEPWAAQYYKGGKNFFDNMLLDLKKDFKIMLMPRYKKQRDYYRQQQFAGIVIPQKSSNIFDIMENCDMFIGAGGTMTREAAVLGVPTICAYQDRLLDVDRFLLDKGLMTYRKDLSAEFVREYIRTARRRDPDQELLDKGRKADELIKQTILGNEGY
jgi:hypothetical protein